MCEAPRPPTAAACMVVRTCGQHDDDRSLGNIKATSPGVGCPEAYYYQEDIMYLTVIKR